MLIMEGLFILAVVTTVHTSPICLFYCDFPLSGGNVQRQSNCKCFVNAHIEVHTNLHQKHNLDKLQDDILKTKSESRHDLFFHENDKTKVNMKTRYKKNIYSATDNNVKRYKRSIEFSNKLIKKHIDANISETKKYKSYERKISGYVSIHTLILSSVSGTAKLSKKWLTRKRANTREYEKHDESNDTLGAEKYRIKNKGTMMNLKFSIDFDNILNYSSIFRDMVNILPPESVMPSQKDMKIILSPDNFLKNINDGTYKSNVPAENDTRLESRNDLTNVIEPDFDKSFRNIKNKKSIEINEGNRKFNKNLRYIENNQNDTSSIATNIRSDNTTIKKLNEQLNCSSPLKNNTNNYFFKSNNTIEALQNKNINSTEKASKTTNKSSQKKFINVYNTSDLTSTRNEAIYDETDFRRSGIIEPSNQKNKQLKTKNIREETTTKTYVTNISFLLPNITLTTKNNKNQSINETANIFHNGVTPLKEKTVMIDNNDIITVLANSIKNSSNEINMFPPNSSSIIFDLPKINNNNRAQYHEGEIPVIRIFSHEFPNDTVISVINGTEVLPNKDFITYEKNMQKLDQNATNNSDSLSILQKNEDNTTNYLLDDKLIPFNESIVGRLYFITDHLTIPALFVQKTNGDVHLGLDISNICEKMNCPK
ncbi:glycosyltransferase-like protein gnt13 [Vanessa cardui]|uniref:glycosyltransferase-like protein gnt13 n=1 Tax=Vanessa cardui TaxID=171605 RepID=UPI001F141881|nr:glycosyltransferase-like protein gnt13 [Vanessa cardui]